MPINKKFPLNLGIQTNQILNNDDEVCLSSILLAVKTPKFFGMIWMTRIIWKLCCFLLEICTSIF